MIYLHGMLKNICVGTYVIFIKPQSQVSIMDSGIQMPADLPICSL